MCVFDFFLIKLFFKLINFYHSIHKNIEILLDCILIYFVMYNIEIIKTKCEIVYFTKYIFHTSSYLI